MGNGIIQHTDGAKAGTVRPVNGNAQEGIDPVGLNQRIILPFRHIGGMVNVQRPGVFDHLGAEHFHVLGKQLAGAVRIVGVLVSDDNLVTF